MEAETIRDYWRLRPHAPAIGTELCPAVEIEEGRAREFHFGRGRNMFRMFVIRHEGVLRGYLNLCPHFSLPLNHELDQFMVDGVIVCVQHFARFRPDDGTCIDGACDDSRLDAVPVYEDVDRLVRVGEAKPA
ncbi:MULTISPECIES: Rieske (2Fe-2S) protein [Sphingobium]|uniref:Rieske (2Fe-2S) protein n=4 Tax=Sphingomonadaceae TaxID=41297 RepID=A0A3G2UM56_SPHYA|nr:MULTISPECIES: Rieske (2Fe-2S) protein [Sphingobium]AEH41581.1 putative ferredoxin [Sphingomonas sp. TTNP3]AYO75674.1 Rieske (2Fe-2S) protein [Sphingobium yanoikuyae]BAV66983.1 putative ferredoxin [Sphingobium cloacae]BBA66303.1 putative ferredoxin [Sphingobium amiense]BBE00507.1 putative ferredoxin [Sphingobium amiense]